MRWLHIDPLLEAAERCGPLVTRHLQNVRAALLDQKPSSAGLPNCTDGRTQSVPPTKGPRIIRRTGWGPSTRDALHYTKMPRMNSVVIADRNPVFLRGLASVLETEGNFVVVGSCQDEAECIAAIRTLSPSLVLLDMSLSKLSGFKLLAAVRKEALPTRVVFLSSSPAAAKRVFAMGASGILPKDGTPESLVSWLQQVVSGQEVGPFPVRSAQISRRGKAEERVSALTARERQIMELVSTGLSNRDVGKRLLLSEGTVKVHLHHIFQKLSIRNRTALANIGRMRPGSTRPPMK